MEPSHPNSKNTRRRPWAHEEDQAITELVSRLGTKQWTAVSDQLEAAFGISGRTGKQCRERWHNHLDPAITKRNWSVAEELTLFESHQSLGNKWADISNLLPGRSDNSIKNHYYSTLRKQYRRLFGTEGTREQLRAQDSVITAEILKILHRKRRPKAHREVARTEPQAESAGEELLMSESAGEDLLISESAGEDLLITGTHLDFPQPSSPMFCFDECPAEFSLMGYSEDLFEAEEVFYLPWWSLKSSDNWRVEC
jgi:myb proto-oncogene protein